MADAWTTMRLLSNAPAASDAWTVLGGITNITPTTAQIAAAVAAELGPKIDEATEWARLGALSAPFL